VRNNPLSPEFRHPSWVAGNDTLVVSRDISEPTPGRVLVIDDDAAVCEMLSRTLQASSFDVVAVTGGAAGLRILRADPSIRLVLLDLQMPEMDGWRFRHEQLSDPKIATVPTIVVTGTPLADILDEHLRATDYLLKPVGRAHLLSVVASYCEPLM